MRERIERLYAEEKKLTIKGMKNAVVKGWITAEDFVLVTGEKFTNSYKGAGTNDGECQCLI